MSADILVVFKKNFESVHDRAMDQIQSDLEQLVEERGIRVEFTAVSYTHLTLPTNREV